MTFKLLADLYKRILKSIKNFPKYRRAFNNYFLATAGTNVLLHCSIILK